MAETLLRYLRISADEIVPETSEQIAKLERGSYQDILESAEAKQLLQPRNAHAYQQDPSPAAATWSSHVVSQLDNKSPDSDQPNDVSIFCIGYAALLAFMQGTVTGPPLKFKPSSVLLPSEVTNSRKMHHDLQSRLFAELSIDGIAPYRLTPHIELFCLARAVMNHPRILKGVKAARWGRIRTSFVHQRLLSETSSALQTLIYDDLDLLADELAASPARDLYVDFLLERSSIHIHHGLDKLARSDLETAKVERHFDFALTGLLGKRTKYQEKETSQLVVLAKSHEQDSSSSTGPIQPEADATSKPGVDKPANLDLNDDTLLESISFAQKPHGASSADIQDSNTLPKTLRELDPAAQPQLQPLDSIILLSLASSITNTSPQDGLTREETLPYATRVLEGGSSDWQVYTQALLVRSRIESYKSRTVERGLLQLQALVDQVIAETAGEASSISDGSAQQASTFLPRAKESESAPVEKRMQHLFQIATPFRWELEAELADRWVQVGGLRSALDIYERLQMWAEAALCWAATDREDKAKKVIRRQLFHATTVGPDAPEDDVGDDEEWNGAERDPAPADAPRLYCLLGDMDKSIAMYEKAWSISKERYARAQRSLGRYYLGVNDFLKAAEAYSKSLRVDQLNQPSWFALGCSLLELAQFQKAAESFSRCVQLDETDAESWSNLAAALLRTDPETYVAGIQETTLQLDDEDEINDIRDTGDQARDARQDLRIDALRALRRAAAIKYESYRIWDNVLTVAASLEPPDYQTVLSSMKRIIELRGSIDGEKAIDVDLLEILVIHIMSTSDTYDPAQPGLQRIVVRFVDEAVVPLITSSARLWQLVSRLALWRNKPATALEAEEKAWRVVTSQPGWETGGKERWDEVVEATVRLCDSYESLGPRERTEGLGAGELVAKDWKFKARSAVRGILGRGKDLWEDSDGWDRLKQAIEGTK